MATKSILEAQNPLILRCNRIMDAFAKSDDERDFYLDRQEGFIIYVDLDKPEEDLRALERELAKNPGRYCLIPKLTFYETKKIMEGFINEKVYDIDTKEKLLDIIQSKEARENFLEFIYDHHSELEKWQTYYQERSRIRIIEWLRANNFHFVFEEDLELPRLLLERLKKELFEVRVGKDVQNARKTLFAKAKTYYSNEALNPRPKRGRPPKQIQKTEIEPQVTTDIYTTVPNGLRGFLFTPDLSGPSTATFSSRFGNEDELFSHRRHAISEHDVTIDSLNQKLEAIRSLSSRWKEVEAEKIKPARSKTYPEDDEEDEEETEEAIFGKMPAINGRKALGKALPAVSTKKRPSAEPPKKTPSREASKRSARHATRIAPKKKATDKPKAKPAVKAKPKPPVKAKAKPKPKVKVKVKVKPKAKLAAKKVQKKAVVKKAKSLKPIKKAKPKKKK